MTGRLKNRDLIFMKHVLIMMQKGLWVLVCSVFLMCICYQINLFEFKGIQETYDMDMVDETYSKEMFQRISNDTDMFVYSAYFDYRYKAVYVICQLNGHKPPSTLTISKNKDFRSDDNILPVHLIPTTFPTMRNFTVCLSPLHNNFSKNMQLLEWLEMTMLLGVDKVDIYVHSCSSDVMTRLQMYQSSEFITIINWPLPKYLCNTYLLHYCGQLAALNDCLYRTKGYSKYIAVMDIDELIIPQKHEDMTWNDILHRLPSKNAYVFRNVIFIRNKSREKTEGNLITQANTLRHTLVFQTFDRSKYIAKADNVETLGIHFVRTMNGSHYSVDPSIGLLHHYRWKGVPGIKINTVQHQVANKYSHELRKRIYLQLNNTNCSRVL
ncbi:uncharacterized protein LOC123528776 isoform X3 [Mercenaria mercenaria]|uniref:uncharacterized protein LOC123528776 isoform X3 n=1 Tax=Mercenaria mercenaria TaxID=6596 RepID=UPI00234E585B|nr:uncharacterized protein LOC123528776 isoform X3 [Mercenaria mercenaria]